MRRALCCETFLGIIQSETRTIFCWFATKRLSDRETNEMKIYMKIRRAWETRISSALLIETSKNTVNGRSSEEARGGGECEETCVTSKGPHLHASLDADDFVTAPKMYNAHTYRTM